MLRFYFWVYGFFYVFFKGFGSILVFDLRVLVSEQKQIFEGDYCRYENGQG